MQKCAFSLIPIQVTSSKPREKGITMMCEEGLALRQCDDLLELAADYIDLAKIAVGTSRIIELDYLQKKILLYKKYRVEPFPGGQFLEYAYHYDLMDEYFNGCKEAGYDTLEVSDNMAPFSDATREMLIRTASQDHGFRVLGEVGSKVDATDVSSLIAQIKLCLKAGCWKVFVEAAEFFSDGAFQDNLLLEIAAEVSLKNIIFELPGPWIAGIHHHQIESLAEWLFEHMGAGVNIANVMPDRIIGVQALRCGGIGATAFKTERPEAIKDLME